MLAENGSDQRARIRALPKGARTRHATTQYTNKDNDTYKK